MTTIDDVYSVEAYVEDIRSIASQHFSDRELTDRIKPFAKRLAASPGWFSDSYREIGPAQGFGAHLLHEEDDHSLAVFVFAWAPGKGTLPHNHKTWAVVAGIEGAEHEVNYNRLDDGSTPGFADLKQSFEETLVPGMVTSCMPEDIHSVTNKGTSPSISLHTYGRHLNHTGRSEFDIASKTVRPYIVKVSKD